MMCADSELDEWYKAELTVRMLIPDWKKISVEDLEEACQKVCEFIDCGQKDDGKKKPRLIDWEQDAELIVPAVNKAAGMEIRAASHLHWWTFFSFFMEIDEGLLSTVLNIRQKKAKHKKLEKWEKQFCSENKELIYLKKPESEEVKAEKESIEKYL